MVFLDERQWLLHAIKRKIKLARKYLNKAKVQLDKCQNWEKEFHYATLLQANFPKILKHASNIELLDWNTNQNVTLSLTPHLSPKEQVAKKFKQAKKLEKGLPFAENEFEKATQQLTYCLEILKNLELIQTEEEFQQLKKQYDLPTPQIQKTKEKPLESKPYIEYFSAKIPIWVGKNAKENDRLTFKWAHGNDLWLHATEVPGSHVVIHSQKEIESETLTDALHLALYHSKAKGEGEVSVCQVKHVKKLGSKPGLVQIAHEKRYFVRLEKDRILKLKKSHHL